MSEHAPQALCGSGLQCTCWPVQHQGWPTNRHENAIQLQTYGGGGRRWRQRLRAAAASESGSNLVSTLLSQDPSLLLHSSSFLFFVSLCAPSTPQAHPKREAASDVWELRAESWRKPIRRLRQCLKCQERRPIRGSQQVDACLLLGVSERGRSQAGLSCAQGRHFPCPGATANPK